MTIGIIDDNQLSNKNKPYRDMAELSNILLNIPELLEIAFQDGSSWRPILRYRTRC